jgi:hypothetical protein
MFKALCSRVLLPGLVAASVAATPSGAAARSSATAEFEGHAIPLESVASHHCHDAAFPVIRCFSTADAAARDLQLVQRRRDRSGATTLSVTSGGSLVAYEHSGYGGASITFTQSWNNLTDLGWNDRISSFKDFGATGSFHAEAFNQGLVYSFSGTQQTSYVGDTYNDKFSSITIN